ncbi:MAG: hypothetical protein H5T69_18115, partial [Chloroflexi bacterium]|nr:hypothetical protein [Chloroflexota bacterium]
GKMLILFHPQDREALETLKTFFPRHTVLTDHDPQGNVALVAFYGQR